MWQIVWIFDNAGGCDYENEKGKENREKPIWKIIIGVVIVAGLLGALLDTEDTETIDDTAPAATTEYTLELVQVGDTVFIDWITAAAVFW